MSLKTLQMSRIEEFRELQSQLNQIRKEKFNGISLFAISSGTSGQGTLNGKLSNDYSFLNADGSTHTETNDYKSFSRELSALSGLSENGSISLNVTTYPCASIGTLPVQ